MASLIQKRNCSILATAIAVLLLVSLLSHSAAANVTDRQKILRLEMLGLDVGDPSIEEKVLETHTLYSVDVLPDGENIRVVIHLSGLPEYDSYLYPEARRLVVDMRNTVNMTPSPKFVLGENDSIREIRNSQYRVTPSIIARVVLDLDESAVPEITAEDNKIIITAPLSEMAPFELQFEETAPSNQGMMVAEAETEVVEVPVNEEATVETITVPAVEVETETPEVEFMVARAMVASDLSVEGEPVEQEMDYVEVAIEQPAEEIVVEEVIEEPAPVEVVEEIVEEPAPVVEIVEEVVEEPAPVEVVEEIAEEPAPVVEVVEEVVEEPAPVEVVEEVVEEPAPVIEVVEEVVEEPAPVEVAEEITEQPAPADEVVEVVIEEPAPEEIVEEAVEEPAPVVRLAMASDEEEEAPEMVAESAPVEEAPAELEEGFEEFGAALEEMMKAMEGAMVEAMEEAGMDAANMQPVVEEAVAPAKPITVETAESVENIDPSQQPVTLSFRDADLNAVLDILARKSGMNIIAGKDVSGRVTVRLVDVPLDTALNAILNINGYGYIKTDNIIQILPLSKIGQEIKTKTDTYTLSYASALKVKETLKSFLTPNGNIEVDERTNMVIVTDVPNNMDRILALIPQMDKRVQQVLIEVLILDSVLTDDADLGISWGLLDTQDRSMNSREDGGPFPDQLNVNLPITGEAISLTFGTLLGDFDLNGFIQAQVVNNDSRVLANPKILTLNNESAAIEIVEEFPYSDVTQTSSGGQLSNITFKEIGTKLEVKPQITHDGHVILWVEPEQNSIAGLTETGVPRVDTRRAETTLIVKNHETIVLGGLRENRSIDAMTKVPFLGDLPGVKYAFRSVSVDKTDTELLVFLTVHIVESPELLPEEKLKASELANLPRWPNGQIELIR